MEPVVIGKTLFREIQVVNGNVVRDVELVSEADSKKQIIEGHVNDVPIGIVRRFKKKTNKKKSSKSGKKKARKTKSTKK